MRLFSTVSAAFGEAAAGSPRRRFPRAAQVAGLAIIPIAAVPAGGLAVAPVRIPTGRRPSGAGPP